MIFRLKSSASLAIPALCAGTLALLVASPAGHADERESSTEGATESVADLRIKHLPAPTTLTMRTALAEGTGKRVASASADAEEHAEEGASVSARQEFQGTGYKPIPTSTRDLQERVIARLIAGYGLDSGALSGDAARSGFDPALQIDRDGEEYAENRNLLLGHLVLGSSGILLPTLNSYIQTRFAFDLLNGQSEFAGLTSSYDTTQLQLNAAYAEMDGFAGEGSPLNNIFLRAGRQYNYGAGNFATMFDGLTAAYDAAGFKVSAFFGQRASVYFDENPGLVGGAGFKMRGQELFNFPVDLSVDYLFFDGGGNDVANLWAEILGVDDVSVARQYIELNYRMTLGSTRLRLRTRIVDNGDLRGDVVQNDDGNNVIEADGITLGRIALQVRQPIGRKLLVVGDIEQRFSGEVAYDFVSAVDTDVVDSVGNVQLVGIGLEPIDNSTLLSLRVNAALTRMFEVYGFTRINIVGDGAQSGFNRPYQDFGAAISARIGQLFLTTAQYRIRLTQLNDDANVEGTDFFDTSGSGVTNFQEIAGDFRFRFGGGARRSSVGLGGYFRVYDFQSPYTKVEDDARAGGRADVEIRARQNLRFKVAADVAQPSPTFAPEVSTLASVRLLTEALF